MQTAVQGEEACPKLPASCTELTASHTLFLEAESAPVKEFVELHFNK